MSRSKQPEVGDITVRSRPQSAVQLTNGRAAQLVLKSCAHCLFSHAASVETLGTSNEVEHLCHTDMRRYTLEWRKEAVPEAITWQDVARGGANGRIEARTGSTKPGLFCQSRACLWCAAQGKCCGLQRAVLSYADARASLLSFGQVADEKDTHGRPIVFYQLRCAAQAAVTVATLYA